MSNAKKPADGFQGLQTLKLTRTCKRNAESRRRNNDSFNLSAYERARKKRGMARRVAPDYSSLRVKLEEAKEEADPRLAWATLEEDLPEDLEREYESACNHDLRHFKMCRDCASGNLCAQGKDLASHREFWLDVIALRNRGYGLPQEPRVQVPGSAYGNFR